MKTARPFDLSKSSRMGRKPRNSLKWLKIHKILNSVVHVMIGVNVFVPLSFAYKTTIDGAFRLHIGLCVLGYQLLMVNAILCFNGNNIWTSCIPMHYRVRAHIALNAAGSVLATAGSLVMMKDKTVNFTTIHGKLALAALVFTGISLINGTISFLSIGRISNIKIAKIIHILTGMITFVLSSSCLTFGYYKNSFKNWASEEFALVMICITCVYTICVISKPLCMIYKKLLNLTKIKTS